MTSFQSVPKHPHLKREAKTGIYYFRKFKAGRGELFKTTGSKTLGKANTIGWGLWEEFIGVRKAKTSSILRVSAVIEGLERELQKDFEDGHRRKRTRAKDKDMFRVIDKYFGDVFIDDLDESFWMDWQREHRTDPPRNFMDIVKYLNKVLTYALSKKIIQRRPQLLVKERERKQSGRCYTDAEVSTMIQKAEGDLRDYLILLAENAFRPHEAREMRWDWVTLEGDLAKVHLPESFTKIWKDREIYVGPKSTRVLRRRRQVLARSQYVFPSPRLKTDTHVQSPYFERSFKEALKRAGLPLTYRAHWLRHTWISKALLVQEVPFDKVSEYVGTSVATLQRRYVISSAELTRKASGAVKIILGGGDSW